MTITKARTSKEPEHWVSVLAESIVENRKPPYIVGSGITTSGPTHLGTACEFLYPNAIYSYLSKEHEAKFYFIGDITDAFDGIPEPLAQFKGELEQELGKPLYTVFDPYGCHSSYGDHFLSEATELMERFDVHPKIIRQNDLYAEGKYDEFTKIYLRNYSLVRDIVFETSLRKATEEEKKKWSPILPICEKCGKVATTVVREFDEEGYEYECSKDVGYTKGCGYVGKNKIEDHKYKLIFRLDWPSRHTFLNTTVEMSGVDHHTKGGTWGTVVAVHNKILKREPPIGLRFGFLLFKGKKYSKSKGFGVDVEALLDLIPSEVIKYYLYRYDAQENKEFDPTGYNLLKIYEDFEYASELETDKELDRADRKKAVAFQISGERKWKAKFLDILIYYQIYKDWKKVNELLGDGTYLSKFIENWISMGYAPEEYSFSFSPKRPENVKVVKEFAGALSEKMNELEVHNLVYEIGKKEETSVSELFKNLYVSIIGKEKGPRMGKLIKAIGINKVKETLLSW